MLQYLIIQLDDSSTSFCHYTNPKSTPKLISLEDLRAAIIFGMKENLMIQYLYPDYDLPIEYQELIESIDHTKIASLESTLQSPDVVVINGWKEDINLKDGVAYVLRLSKQTLFDNQDNIFSQLKNTSRINIVLTDIETFTDDDFQKYEKLLENLSKVIETIYVSGQYPQINILTDRVFVSQMNNCDAGNTNITIAPDGRFYVCPAFYYEKAENEFMGLGGPKESPFSIGDLTNGLDIKNKQLYKIDHAPLCKTCDAFQCKRCVWLNRKMTYEVNTPSHEQCVIAHLERNASRKLLQNLKDKVSIMKDIEQIKEINYLDPFDVRKVW